MELNKIDLQIKALKEEEANKTKLIKKKIKELKAKQKTEFNKKINALSKNYIKGVKNETWEKVFKIIESNPDINLELYINGKPLNQYIEDNN